MFSFWRKKPKEEPKEPPRDKPTFQRFEVPAGDPLAPEHHLITCWGDAAVASLDERHRWSNVELKNLPEGQAILDAPADRGSRVVMASLVQLLHWDAQVERIRSHAKTDTEKYNPNHIP